MEIEPPLPVLCVHTIVPEAPSSIYKYPVLPFSRLEMVDSVTPLVSINLNVTVLDNVFRFE